MWKRKKKKKTEDTAATKQLKESPKKLSAENRQPAKSKESAGESVEPQIKTEETEIESDGDVESDQVKAQEKPNVEEKPQKATTKEQGDSADDSGEDEWPFQLNFGRPARPEEIMLDDEVTCLKCNIFFSNSMTN